MTQPTRLVVCIENEDSVDLQVLKVYPRLADATAESKGFLRVIDDSGEDYLYPEAWFLPVPLPPSVEERLEALAAERLRVELG